MESPSLIIYTTKPSYGEAPRAYVQASNATAAAHEYLRLLMDAGMIPVEKAKPTPHARCRCDCDCEACGDCEYGHDDPDDLVFQPGAAGAHDWSISPLADGSPELDIWWQWGKTTGAGAESRAGNDTNVHHWAVRFFPTVLLPVGRRAGAWIPTAVEGVSVAEIDA